MDGQNGKQNVCVCDVLWGKIDEERVRERQREGKMFSLKKTKSVVRIFIYLLFFYLASNSLDFSSSLFLLKQKKKNKKANKTKTIIMIKMNEKHFRLKIK